MPIVSDCVAVLVTEIPRDSAVRVVAAPIEMICAKYGVSPAVIAANVLAAEELARKT